MFALFERRLKPTATPTQPEPPPRLIAFYWHYARQAKGLFAGLFAAGFTVALLDSLIPVFIGRIVTLITSSRPETLFATFWPLLLGMAVAATAEITGALLVFALLVTPAATAQQLTARPLPGLALSVALALVVTWVGLGIAYFSPYPVGFWVTSLSFGLYLAVRLIVRARALPGDRAAGALA